MNSWLDSEPQIRKLLPTELWLIINRIIFEENRSRLQERLRFFQTISPPQTSATGLLIYDMYVISVLENYRLTDFRDICRSAGRINRFTISEEYARRDVEILNLFETLTHEYRLFYHADGGLGAKFYYTSVRTRDAVREERFLFYKN